MSYRNLSKSKDNLGLNLKVNSIEANSQIANNITSEPGQPLTLTSNTEIFLDSDVRFENAFVDIDNTRLFSGYSYGSYDLNFNNSPGDDSFIGPSSIVTLTYTRLDSLVTVEIGEILITRNLAPTSPGQLFNSIQLPEDLKPQSDKKCVLTMSDSGGNQLIGTAVFNDNIEIFLNANQAFPASGDLLLTNPFSISYNILI